MTPSGRALKVGRFAWTFDDGGLGQVIGLPGSRCTVRFFRSVNESFDREYDSAKIEGAYLSPQTRAYVRGEASGWIVGRIVDYLLEGDQLSYDVQFPNKITRTIPEPDLRVRCLLPIEDPTAVLATGGMETQYLYDRRRAALGCLAEARAASYGLTGLLSASVELLPHQVDVARRVLSDPIQRYLLADEVGLGKTIEACAIIRQAILDNPKERVVVLAPGSLTGQWKKELASRFFIKSPEHQLLVLPFDQLSRIDASAVDTIVVDEAHNVISSDPAQDSSYKALERLATGAKRLLLISATPVLGHERAFLALLHLLDPQVYGLDEEASFLQKLRLRQDFGRVLLALNPSQPPAFLKRTLQSLVDLVPSDEMVRELTRAVMTGLETGRGVDSEAIRVIQQHMGDTYRLHQRLMRTRRRDLPEYVLAPRISILAHLEEDLDERSPSLVDALDQWRKRSLEALATLPEDEREAFEHKMAARYALLHESLGISVEACVDALVKQLDNPQNNGATFREDVEALTYGLSQAKQETEQHRTDLAINVVQTALRILGQKTKRPRLVLFSSSSEVARALVVELQGNISAEVFGIVESSNDLEISAAIEGFSKTSHGAALVCDRRGEEGLNLQFAHGIVHLDLPLAPDRIEQRIGRLDRFGRERNDLQEIFHWVITPYSDEYHEWQAWFELLRDGFGIFDQSISEVQFLLEDLAEDIRLAMYRRGARGLQTLAPAVRNSMTKERQRLDEQYALDRRMPNSNEGEDEFRAIERVDTVQHYQPLDIWLTQVLEFRRQPVDRLKTAFNLHWTQGTLIPREPWQRSITEGRLAEPMTYDRAYAAYGQGFRLVRPGLELIDSLESLLRWDDRGTAFATWRCDSRWAGEGRGTWLGFRLTYVLEANAQEAQRGLGGKIDATLDRSLRRRMDFLMPPWTVTIDMDIGTKPVSDPLLKQILARPYSKSDGLGRVDFNLGSRRDLLYATVGFPELADACQQAREASRASLLNSAQFQQWVGASVGRAVDRLKAENERLKRRVGAINRETGSLDHGLEQQIRINETIAAALATPSIRLDAIGLFVISRNPPEFPVDDEQTDEPESPGNP